MADREELLRDKRLASEDIRIAEQDLRAANVRWNRAIQALEDFDSKRRTQSDRGGVE